MMTPSNGNISPLLGLRAGNSWATAEFPSQKPVMRSFGVFFDRHLDKPRSKQSWRRWFETPWHSLWRHCNEYAICVTITLMRHHLINTAIELRVLCYAHVTSFWWRIVVFQTGTRRLTWSSCGRPWDHSPSGRSWSYPSLLSRITPWVTARVSSAQVGTAATLTGKCCHFVYMSREGRKFHQNDDIWGRKKLIAIFQMAFANSFPWIKIDGF